jgi:hypothetical protein
MKCAKYCEETTQLWMQLMEDTELQTLATQIQPLQEKVLNLATTLFTLPPNENMKTMMEIRQHSNELNQLQEKQQAQKVKIVPLQEVAYKVMEELASNIRGGQIVRT